MKKVLAFVLALVMVLSMAACGNDGTRLFPRNSKLHRHGKLRKAGGGEERWYD